MKSLLAFAGLLALTGAVQAQTRCVEADTFSSCSDRLAGQLNPQVNADKAVIAQRKAEAASAAADAPTAVAAKNTGDATTSTINDFLPLLRALVDSGGFSGQEGDKLGLEWSNPLGLPAEHQNKVTVGLVRSEVFEPIRDGLRAAGLDEQIGTLEDDIDEGDDVTVGFSYARASERYGRDPRLHAKLISDLLQQAGTDLGAEVAIREKRKPVTDFERTVLLSGRTVDFNKPFRDIGLTEPEKQQYMSLVETQIQAEHESMRALAGRLQNARFYGVLDLINNQPQLSFTAEYRAREDVVGPDELKAAVSYEMGFSNVNTYRDYERGNCSVSEQLLCLASYLSRDDVIANIKESRRLTIKAEYSQLKRVNFSLPGTTPFTFSAEPVKRFSVSGGLGRYLGKEVGGRTRARVDATLSYEDFSDDPSRQDRGLATATFTYPVSEGFFLSVGAVYATKPEFRGDVDKELSARAGITYKVIPDR